MGAYQSYHAAEGHVYLNIKGRDPQGIVEPQDQYEVEEEVMTALYSLKSKETGHRIVSVALRNRDAVLLGQGGRKQAISSFGWQRVIIMIMRIAWLQRGEKVIPLYRPYL